MKLRSVIGNTLLAARLVHGDGTALVRLAVREAWPEGKGALDVYCVVDDPVPFLAERALLTDRSAKARNRSATSPPNRSATRRADRQEAHRERLAIRAEQRRIRELRQAEQRQHRRAQAALRAERAREERQARLPEPPELDPETILHNCRAALTGITRVFGENSAQAANARVSLVHAEAEVRRARSS